MIFFPRSDPLCGGVGDQRGDEERHSGVVREGGDQGQGGDQTDEDEDVVSVWGCCGLVHFWPVQFRPFPWSQGVIGW